MISALVCFFSDIIWGFNALGSAFHRDSMTRLIIDFPLVKIRFLSVLPRKFHLPAFEFMENLHIVIIVYFLQILMDPLILKEILIVKVVKAFPTQCH